MGAKKPKNHKWNESRIFDGVDREKLSKNWNEIQRNDAMLDAFLKSQGLKREDVPYPDRMKILDKLIKEWNDKA